MSAEMMFITAPTRLSARLVESQLVRQTKFRDASGMTPVCEQKRKIHHADDGACCRRSILLLVVVMMQERNRKVTACGAK
jgi:hypothetical protein